MSFAPTLGQVERFLDLFEKMISSLAKIQETLQRLADQPANDFSER